MMLTVSKEAQDASGSPELFSSCLREAVGLLKWGSDDVDGSVRIGLDGMLPEGGARAVHSENGVHEILLNPKSDKPFPWPTIRHEMLHCLLKERITRNFEMLTFTLPVASSYANQTFRENLEEYFVRALNVMPMREQLGEEWHRRQIRKEIESGFRLMEKASYFVARFHAGHAPFDAKTFIDFASALRA